MTALFLLLPFNALADGDNGAVAAATEAAIAAHSQVTGEGDD